MSHSARSTRPGSASASCSEWRRERKRSVHPHSVEAVFLGDRVVVMSRRPGVIKEDVRIDRARINGRWKSFSPIRKSISPTSCGPSEVDGVPPRPEEPRLGAGLRRLGRNSIPDVARAILRFSGMLRAGLPFLCRSPSALVAQPSVSRPRTGVADGKSRKGRAALGVIWQRRGQPATPHSGVLISIAIGVPLGLLIGSSHVPR